MIRLYKPCEDFSEEGRVTPFFDNVKEGDELTVGGPKSNFWYQGNFNNYNNKLDMTIFTKNYIFVSGGTGLVPLYDIM